MRICGLPVLPKARQIRHWPEKSVITKSTNPDVADRIMQFHAKLVGVFYRAMNEREAYLKAQGYQDVADDLEFCCLFSEWMHYSTKYKLNRVEACNVTKKFYSPRAAHSA